MAKTANSSKKSYTAEERQQAVWLRPYHYGPGQSGNPSGRPKKKPITDRYHEQLETIAPPDIAEELGLPPGKATMADVIARRMAIRAVSSNRAVEAAREMREAVEGKAPQAFELKHGGEVTINVRFGNRKAHQRASA